MPARRDFIKSLTALTCTGLLAGCRRSSSEPVPARKIKLGPVNKFSAAETALFIERILVKRDANGLSAMSLVCTHQACMVRNDDLSSRHFLCPCHGSRFNERGEVQSGPASKDLPWIELEIDQEKNLWALFGKEVTPDWRLPGA